ncbi:unnamed protein product [Linum trigynum]|uniref:Uncharacterized protein n=1 Tax=Linum trigynum TaxID=586398 RepID=A0AAV2GVY3_9ROSI
MFNFKSHGHGNPGQGIGDKGQVANLLEKIATSLHFGQGRHPVHKADFGNSHGYLRIYSIIYADMAGSPLLTRQACLVPRKD